MRAEAIRVKKPRREAPRRKRAHHIRSAHSSSYLSFRKQKSTTKVVKDLVPTSSAMVRAKEFQSRIGTEFPSCIKTMVYSQVTSGFWMGLPLHFCKKYLPKDATFVLEDEKGEQWEIYIFKENESNEVEGALSLLDLEAQPEQMTPVTPAVRIKRNKDPESLSSTMVQKKQKNSAPAQLSGHSGNNSEEAGSEVFEVSRFCIPAVSFEEVKSFEDFHIVVKGLCIDHELPDDVRMSYYNLCSDKKQYLHDGLPESLYHKLVVGIIGELVSIADKIKNCKLTTTKEEFERWDNSLKSFKLLGMNVGFLRDRMHALRALVLESEGAVDIMKYVEAEKQHAFVENEMTKTASKLKELKVSAKKLEGVMGPLKQIAEKYEHKLREEADAPCAFGGGAPVVVLWCCGGVVVVLWWCCGGVVVVLWWSCGGGVVLLLWLLFGSGVVLLNMENYEDDPVSLTCRNLDDSQENCVLIHFMSCRQVERSPEDTVVVPLTYHVNGHYIEFGREEFCLITGLRFGPEFSDRYEAYKMRREGHDSGGGQKKNEAHRKIAEEVYKFNQDKSQPNPKEVLNTMGLSDLILAFFKTMRTPTYPRRLRANSVSASHLSSRTPKFTTPMPLQGIAHGSSTNQVASLNEMPRGKRETFPSKYQLSPFTCMPTTTVAPKKRANNTRNKTRSDKVSAFNIEKAGIDLNSPVEDLVYMGSHDTDVYISLHNVDPNKVVRNQYVDCMTFLGSPKPVFLDCGIKGFVVEEQFWRDLVPYVCKGGNNTKNNYQRFAWLSEDHINFWMELMIRDRPPGARYTVAKTGTSAMIEKSNKFVIETDFHLMGMLDGSSASLTLHGIGCNIVYMPINSEVITG
ncbi:putative transcription factor B3-Domain family protein [Tanacetum coccineum]